MFRRVLCSISLFFALRETTLASVVALKNAAQRSCASHFAEMIGIMESQIEEVSNRYYEQDCRNRVARVLPSLSLWAEHFVARHPVLGVTLTESLRVLRASRHARVEFYDVSNAGHPVPVPGVRHQLEVETRSITLSFQPLASKLDAWLGLARTQVVTFQFRTTTCSVDNCGLHVTKGLCVQDPRNPSSLSSPTSSSSSSNFLLMAFCDMAFPNPDAPLVVSRHKLRSVFGESLLAFDMLLFAAMVAANVSLVKFSSVRRRLLWLYETRTYDTAPLVDQFCLERGLYTEEPPGYAKLSSMARLPEPYFGRGRALTAGSSRLLLVQDVFDQFLASLQTCSSCYNMARLCPQCSDTLLCGCRALCGICGGSLCEDCTNFCDGCNHALCENCEREHPEQDVAPCYVCEEMTCGTCSWEEITGEKPKRCCQLCYAEAKSKQMRAGCQAACATARNDIM